MLAILMVHCDKVMKGLNTKQIKIEEWMKMRRGEKMFIFVLIAAF